MPYWLKNIIPAEQLLRKLGNGKHGFMVNVVHENKRHSGNARINIEGGRNEGQHM